MHKDVPQNARGTVKRRSGNWGPPDARTEIQSGNKQHRSGGESHREPCLGTTRRNRLEYRGRSECGRRLLKGTFGNGGAHRPSEPNWC